MVSMYIHQVRDHEIDAYQFAPTKVYGHPCWSAKGVVEFEFLIKAISESLHFNLDEDYHHTSGWISIIESVH